MATPPVFTSGSVLTAAQMNAVGLWLVKAGSFSGATSHSVDSVFSSDYRNYRLVFSNLSTASGSVGISLRLRSSSGDYNGPTHKRMIVGLTSGGTASNITGTTDTSLYLLDSGVTTAKHGASIDLLNPQEAQQTIALSQAVFQWTDGFYFRGGGQVIDTTTQFTGFSVICSVNVSGSYAVYGYND